MTDRTCGEAAIALLEAYGVDTVFGIPGVHTLDLYKGLARSRIRHVLARHEQGAGFMADGYARVTGRPGVVVPITGPGVTNAATAIGQAWSDSVPMLVLSSENPTKDLRLGRGRLHEITNQEAVTAPMCAFSATARRPEEVPELIHRAFATFAAQRPRPVHISIPLDVLAAPAAFPAKARPLPSKPQPDEAALARAARLLDAAERPVIIAGGGAVGAEEPLRAIAERLGAPVILTIAAKGMLPETHPLCLGGTLPDRNTQQLLEMADLVLAVGTELAETECWVETLPLGRMIRIDIDESQIAKSAYPAEEGIVSDAGPALDGLLRRLGGGNRPGGLAGKVPAVRSTIAAGTRPLRRKHLTLLETVREAVPVETAIMTDMTQIAYSGNQRHPSARPRTWHHPNGFGTLGWALPAAIGAKLARPDLPVLPIIGDAGILFTVQELSTAANLKLPLPILLWNNDGLGQIRDDMIERKIPEIGVTPEQNPDYQMLAAAFGCHALRPRNLREVAEALRAALDADRPTLIEVRQDSPFL
jgi:thiamine pyrophosphate-dependent acetolactate synthase large subunit-like protein